QPSDCIAKPTEKITCCVPETQMDPDGLSTRPHASSQARVKAWSASMPAEASQAPFPTGARRPDWQGKPPLLREDGGWGGSGADAPPPPRPPPPPAPPPA